MGGERAGRAHVNLVDKGPVHTRIFQIFNSLRLNGCGVLPSSQHTLRFCYVVPLLTHLRPQDNFIGHARVWCYLFIYCFGVLGRGTCKNSTLISMCVLSLMCICSPSSKRRWPSLSRPPRQPETTSAHLQTPVSRTRSPSAVVPMATETPAPRRTVADPWPRTTHLLRPRPPTAGRPRWDKKTKPRRRRTKRGPSR